MNTRTWLAAGLLVASLPLHAANPFQPIELSDPELDQLRGRYVLPDRIISFGVVMTSSWQDSTGQIIGAQVALNISGAQSQPTLYITRIDQAGSGNALTAGNGQIIGGAGLGSVQGIVQSVRTAGDYNTGLNDLSVQISKGNEQPVPISGEAWNGSQGFSNGAGTVKITALNGGLNIAVQASNGQGHSSQQIGGGVSQHANIGGSLNSVRNVAALSVALRDNPRAVNMTSCLEQLRALRPSGY
ncbi:hypothetical protein [Pseudomonas sp.]|jgi:hypothetical protein|uniref:hypothetical protein n=1 Tax=Pseudomonas sp. TaxID=306 RepID=UPI0027303967|nr:hypothetical protein [Pseudomonas sp.]MDP2245446.1 hypothetical protein [Pseudomonas sp.]